MYDYHLKSPSAAPAPAWLPPGVSTAPAPSPGAFTVTANGNAIPVLRVGASRRAASAEKRTWSALIQAHVFLELANPLPEGATVEGDDGQTYTKQNGELIPVE